MKQSRNNTLHIFVDVNSLNNIWRLLLLFQMRTIDAAPEETAIDSIIHESC